MDTSECPPEEALHRMASFPEAETFDRAEFSRLFATAQHADRELALSKYCDGIATLVRRKIDASDEILRAYHVLSGAAPSSLAETLANAADKSRGARLLRRFACRLIIKDSNVHVPFETLEDIALDGDAGRLTVIDFLSTRKRPTADGARFVVQLINQYGSKNRLFIVERRGENIERMLRLSKTLSELILELPEVVRTEIERQNKTQVLLFVGPASEMKSKVPLLKSLAPPEMALWISRFRRAFSSPNRNHSDKDRYTYSNIIGNLARDFQNDPVVIDLLAFAIDLEVMAAQPSDWIFSKVWRVCVVTRKYGGHAYPVLARGLALCVQKCALHPSHAVHKNFDDRLDSVGSLVRQISDWGPLVDGIIALNDLKLRPKVAQLLVHFAYSPNDTRGKECRKDIDRLMRITLPRAICSDLEWLHLHESYANSFGAYVDDAKIGLLVENKNLDLEMRLKAGYYDIKAATSAAEAFNRCKRLAPLLNVIHRVGKTAHVERFRQILEEHAFIAISEKLRIQLTLHDTSVPLARNDWGAALREALYDRPPLNGIHLAYRVFQILRNAGDQFDAYLALRAMLVRAKELTGVSGVRFRAYRRALRIYMSKELQLPESEIERAIYDNFGYDEPLNDGLDGDVEVVANATLQKPYAKALDQFETGYEELLTTMMNDPILGLANEAALAVPTLATFQRRASNTVLGKDVLAQISSLICAAREMTRTNWIDELRVSEKLAMLSFIYANLPTSSSAMETNIDPQAAEKVQGKPILAIRQHLNRSDEPPNISDSELHEVPGNLICISLSFDSTDTLIVTRREQGYATVSTRLPEVRTTLLKKQNETITYSQAVAEINNIIKESGSLQASNDDSTEREQFWKTQYALDDRMQNVLVSVQRSWIAGFGALFSPQPGALNVGDDLIDAVRLAIESHLVVHKPRHLTLSATWVACVRDASIRNSFSQLQDLLHSLFDCLNLQGASIPVDELNFPHIMEDVKAKVRKFVVPENEREAPKHIVLVCDRKASVLPWEMLPVLQRSSVTRALSLHQVAEWAKEQRTGQGKDPYHPASDEKVTMVLNPQGNLPLSQKRFSTEFRLRGWQGFIGKAPSREEFVKSFKDSGSLVYVGHGSDLMITDPGTIRQQFLTKTCVFLFGCRSAAMKYPLFNRDNITSFAIAGSRIVLGALWTVKTNDCDRFTSEFLSRVFDDKEPVGRALWESRKACMLPYLTSAAWVLYGLP